MTKKKFHVGFSLCVLFLLLFSCISKDEKKRTVENTLSSEGIVSASKNPEQRAAKVEQIKKIFYSLPSPLELTILFKKEGVEYHSDKLHKVEQRNNYNLTNKKALNLGIYGADLSYAGLFGKHEDAIEYFTSCQIMAEEIGIGQTFRKEFISRIEKNASNKDTLLQVISDFFLDNDAYLKDHRQQDISTYVLTGGWVEGMYLGTQMTTSSSNSKGIRNIIAGQKYSLENLLLLLKDLDDSEEIIKLKGQLKLLHDHFDEINYGSKNREEHSKKNADGKLIIDTGNSNTDIADSTFIKIKAQITNIRYFIVE